MQHGTSREGFRQWLVGMWLVWKALCAEKHEQKGAQWDSLQQESVMYIDSYEEARHQAALASRVMPREGSANWSKPRRGRFRLDVDYALGNSSGMGGIGAILRDGNGEIMFALAKPVSRAVTVLHGELQALIFGIKQCVEEAYAPVEAYSDSMLAVLAVVEEDERTSVLLEYMFDFFTMVNNLNVLSVNHVRREANKAAHKLARFASSSNSTSLWHDNWPS